MKQFLVQYRLPYTHVVTVGVEAENEQAACAKAREAFESGNIWDDTPTMPLLQDSYEENAESDVLEFRAIESEDPLSFVRENTMQLVVKEYRNDSIDLADDTWIREDV